MKNKQAIRDEIKKLRDDMENIIARDYQSSDDMIQYANMNHQVNILFAQLFNK